MYKYPRKGGKEDGVKLFPVVPSDRTKDNGHKLRHRKIPLNITKDFLSEMVSKHQQRDSGIFIHREIRKSSGHGSGQLDFFKKWLAPSEFQRSLLTSTI